MATRTATAKAEAPALHADNPRAALLLKIATAADAMTSPKKNSNNPHFKSKFAGLDQTMAVVEPVLQEVGLGHNTVFRGTEIVYSVWDIDTGETQESVVALASVMEDLTGNVWQQIGQAFTYLRRYLAQAFWNLVPEDDDAQSAPSRAASPAREKKDAAKAAAAPKAAAATEPEDNGVL